MPRSSRCVTFKPTRLNRELPDPVVLVDPLKAAIKIYAISIKVRLCGSPRLPRDSSSELQKQPTLSHSRIRNEIIQAMEKKTTWRSSILFKSKYFGDIIISLKQIVIRFDVGFQRDYVRYRRIILLTNKFFDPKESRLLMSH